MYKHSKNQLLSNRILSTSNSNEEISKDEVNNLSVETTASNMSVECKCCKTINSSEDQFCYNCGESLINEAH